MSVLFDQSSHELANPDLSTGRKGSADITTHQKSDPRRVLACGLCRKRKLKCDGKRPKCGTCSRLQHDCAYDEVRKKSGPKRGYVKELEARLKQVENLLEKTIDTAPLQESVIPEPRPHQQNASLQNMHQQWSNNDVQIPVVFDEPIITNDIPDMTGTENMMDLSMNDNQDFMGGMEDFNWDMIALGLEEPLPDQEIMDQLYNVYFEKVHPSLPMIHRSRFLASLNLSANHRPPVCLRYIMWAHACLMIPRYKSSADPFYEKARKYIQQDEMRGHGEHCVSIGHAQAWVLISTYEFKTMYFPRAWMSCGRASRLALLMGLNRQDRVGLDVKQTMAPPKDWTEQEERRRTFWMAYCQDRYASVGTGWPMMLDERDILSNLPASEEAYLTSRQESTAVLSEILAGNSASSFSNLSSFAAVCLMTTLLGRNLTHLHRPSDTDNVDDLNGEFWKRHRSLDNILLNTSLSLPAHLRLPNGLHNSNIIFANMNIHTSTICLHQAAIFKADKHKLPLQISAESKRRCIVAADQTTNIMKMCCHQDLSSLNPVIAFCLYVAARVFVQYLKSKRDDNAVRSSLIFLLSAMSAMRHGNPLTESFLVQLDVDLEGSGLGIPSPLGMSKFTAKQNFLCNKGTAPNGINEGVECMPIINIQESRNNTSKNIADDTPSMFDMSNADLTGLGTLPVAHNAFPYNQPYPMTDSTNWNGTADANQYANQFGIFSSAPAHIPQTQSNANEYNKPTMFRNSSTQSVSPGNGSDRSNLNTPAASDSHIHSNGSNTDFSPPENNGITMTGETASNSFFPQFNAVHKAKTLQRVESQTEAQSNLDFARMRMSNGMRTDSFPQNLNKSQNFAAFLNHGGSDTNGQDQIDYTNENMQSTMSGSNRSADFGGTMDENYFEGVTFSPGFLVDGTGFTPAASGMTPGPTDSTPATSTHEVHNGRKWSYNE